MTSRQVMILKADYKVKWEQKNRKLANLALIRRDKTEDIYAWKCFTWKMNQKAFSSHGSLSRFSLFFHWAKPGLFLVYFRCFHIPIQMTNIWFDLNKVKMFCWDSNRGAQDGKPSQFHWANVGVLSAATTTKISLFILSRSHGGGIVETFQWSIRRLKF